VRSLAAFPVCWFIAILGWAATDLAHAECRLEPGPQRTVVRVLDGETFVLDDGSEVRLAGALAPRGSDAGVGDAEWPSAGAAKAALQTVLVGQTVVLGYHGNLRRDRQNRHVAQAFIVDGAKETWVQGHMLRTGHARATQQRDARGCADDLLAHEQVARAEGRGIWSIAAYQTRLAQRTRDLEGMTARFAVLAGRIAWVAEGREATALGFTPARTRGASAGVSGRRGVVVMIEARDRDLLGTLGGDAKALEGRTVEVRGWLEQRLGRPPGTYVMDVSAAGMIMLKDASAATAHAPEPPVQGSTP
jgi:micrococcal nuclease